MRMNWDYIAGLFDGEGSIQIKDYPDRSQGRGIVLVIGITDWGVLDRLKEFLETQGIKSSVYRRTALRGKERKPTQWWQISNKWDATRFLLAIRNRVIVKKNRLLEALEFRKRLTAHTRPFTTFELDIIRAGTSEGQSLKEIAKLLGCGQSKVLKTRKILGIVGNHSLYHKKGIPHQKFPDVEQIKSEDVLVFRKERVI